MNVLMRQTGTLADGENTFASPVFWDDSVGAQYDPQDLTVLTVTTTVEMTVTIREAASRAELTTPYGGLNHEFAQVIPAGETRRLIVGQDDSLGAGWAWLSNASGAAGNYVITGSRRGSF